MSPSSKETQRQTLLHLRNEGIRYASELHSRTHIPLSTIYYNINKLEKNGSVNHKRGNGSPRKIIANVSRAINILVAWLRIFLRKMSQKSWIGLLTVLTLTPLKTSERLSKERQKGACLRISMNWRGLWWKNGMLSQQRSN